MSGKTLSRLFIPLLSAVMISATASDVITLPASVDQHAFRLVGSGEFRKFGFHLYDASYWQADDAQALRITYRKNIASSRLVEQTEKEWRRLGIASRARAEAWGRELDRIWPNVSSGDTLIAVVDEELKQTEFFDGAGQSIGCVYDPEFGPAFLGIWLNPKTSARRLRVALVGEASTTS